MGKTRNPLLPLDASVRIDEEDIKKALKRPADFGYGGDREEMFETWALGPVLRTRDSGILDNANADAIVSYLEKDPTLADDWEVISCNHWAVGWVEHLSFRVIDEDGSPSRVFRVIKEIYNALSEYPVVDDELFSEREHEAALKNIADDGQRWVRENAPEEWPYMVWSWLWDHEQSECENRGGNGAAPSDAAIKRALRALHLINPDEDDEAPGTSLA